VATQTTLEALCDGQATAKVLLFIENYGERYASRIAKTSTPGIATVDTARPQ
jgi:hypothetical protein